ncbi:amino acid adenylation domain-containing protein [Pseudoalteromonas sp. McH1-7]|uniref:non-ribosomal peptide synthetase n=1 Tax=Pseudoalteromonas sp. McH1-7 TaxID=2745574 RepID=UPI001592947D|nr:non-ribosomal peptide synthetase [Pseudoalteromonas sp. McH1-7]NUZ10464.1 amino acid adenylation domain-containing protein [Pseudoalteromonas sp. McH1-7]
MNEQQRQIEALIAEALAAGVTLYEKNGGLAFKQTAGFPPQLKQQVVEYKSEIIAYFQQQSRDMAKSSPHIITQPNAGKDLPLSFAQEGLWFIEQLQGSKQYYMPAEFLLRGELNIPAMRSAVQDVVQRHEILRARFVKNEQDGQPQLQITDDISAPFEWLDASVAAEETRQAYIASRIAAHQNKPFDLAHDCLLRVLVVSDGDEHHLAFNMHHIVSDGASMALLAQEIEAGYCKHIGTSYTPLATMQVQYSDFSQWQRAQLTPDRIEAPLAQLKQQFSELAPLQSLPCDFVRPAVQSLTGKVYRQALDTSLFAAISTQAKSLQLTPFMWLLNTFMLFIARLTQSQQVVVGTPELGRHHPELTPLIGLFVNTLVMQAKLESDMPFSQWLQQQKDLNLAAFEYRDIPFDKVVEAVGAPRDLSHHPLVQILFTLETRDERAFTLPGLSVQEVQKKQADSIPVKCDIELNAIVDKQALYLHWKFDSHLYTEETIKHWADCFHTLLQACVTAPHTAVGELALLNQKQQQALITGAQCHGATWPKQDTITSLFTRYAERFATRTAVQDSTTVLSYRELNTRVDALAIMLLQQGVTPRTMLVVSVSRSIEMIVTLLAVLRVGAAYVPVDPDYPQERIEYILEDVQSPWLLCDNATQAQFSQLSYQLINVSQAEHQVSREALKQLDVIQIEPQDLAYMIYTSGTTGRPKGVQIEHRHVVRLLHVEPNLFDFNEQDIWTLFHSFCFDFSVWEMYGALLFGGRLVVVDKVTAQDTQAFAQLLVDAQVTVLNQTPSAFYALQATLLNDSHLASECVVRYVIFGGEALQPSKLQPWAQQLSNCQLINMYGITETTVHVTFKALEPADLTLGTSNIGHAIPTTSCYVLDDKQRLLPQGAVGELYVGGEGVCRGYWQRDELNATRFIQNPFSAAPDQRLYRSGDLVRLMVSGELSYVGRIDDQVKVRGYRIELGEIENQLRHHPEVAEVTVLLNRQDPENVWICAFVVLHKQVEFDDITLVMQQFLKQNLPDHMLPAKVQAVAAMPLTSNGKVDKKALLQQLDTSFNENTYEAPIGELETQLASYFSEILQCESVGRYDDFFRLGGHSLLAAKLANHIRKTLQIELPLQTIFTHPTVQGLATALEKQDTQLSTIVVVDKTNGVVLSFAQQRLWTLDQMQQGSQQYQIQALLAFSGKLDLSAFEQSWQKVLSRHQVLHSTITNTNGQPKQYLVALPEQFVTLIDVSTQSPLWQNLLWQRAVRDDQAQGFDFSKDLMIRVTLVRFSSGYHRLIVNMHHIASDAGSIEVLMRELTQFYAHYAQGCELARNLIAPPEVQYADYAHWHRAQCQGAQQSADMKFWSAHLDGAPPLHQLPLDTPRVQAMNNSAQAFDQQLSAETWQQLQQHCQRLAITPFIWLHSAYAVMLAKFSKVDDIVIGAPFSGRHHPQVEQLIGFFVNALPIRVKLDWQQSFSQLLDIQKEQIEQVHQHQSLPFEQLIDHLGVSRELSHQSVFQLSFAFNPEPQHTPEFVGLSTEVLTSENARAKFDLELSATLSGQGLRLHWLYNSGLFEKEMVASIAECFNLVIAQLLAQPDCALAGIKLCKEQPLADYAISGKSAPEHLEQSVLEQIERNMAEPAQAERLAVIDTNSKQTLSYGELNERTKALAALLLSEGLQSEQPVLVAMTGSADLIVAMLAVLKAGGCYVPVDPHYPQARVNYIAKDSGAALVLTKCEFAARFESAELDDNHIDADYRSPHVICVDDADVRARLAAISIPQQFPEVNVEQLAYVIYTSGTTGNPKGVMIAHQGLANLCAWHQRAFAVDTHSVASQTANPAFDAATWEVWPYLCAGASLVCVTKAVLQSPAELTTCFNTHQVTHSFIATPIAQALLTEPLFNPQSLRYLLVGGDKLGALQAKEYEFTLVNNYGPTEASVVATSGVVEFDEQVPDIGLPVDNSQLFILDPQLRAVPQGMIGELYITGAGLARGYLHQPQLSAERFIELQVSPSQTVRAYKTGDLVRQLSNGRIAYMGRNDGQVKLRGYRIELAEIEQQIGLLSGVQECAVQITTSASGQPQLQAFVVANIEPKELQTQLKERLPSYMVPEHFVMLEKLPLTPHGKVDHRALATLGKTQQTITVTEQSALVPQANSVVAQLLAIYRQVLNTPSMTAEDDYFALGGDSILSIQIASKAKVLKLPVSATDVFTYPSVSALAARLAQQDILVPTDRERLPLVGQLDKLPIQYWFFAQQFAKPSHWDQSVLVSVDKSVTPAQLMEVVKYLLTQHDALRLVVADENTLFVRDSIDIQKVFTAHTLEREVWQAELSEFSEQVQQGFAFTSTPLFKAVLFVTPNSEANNRLLFSAHHLLVDGVSWRVLLEDVSQLLQQQINNVPVELPAASANLAELAVFYRELASNERDLRKWQKVAALAESSHLLSLKDTSATPTIAKARHTLSASHTRALLGSANTSYGTTAQALLLSALAWCAQKRGAGSEVIMLEGHGRELLTEALDSSRTIGWLTALYPMPLFSNGSRLHDVICSIKAELERSAKVASSYGAARYLHPEPNVRSSLEIDTRDLLFFNYLGQLDTVIEQQGLLGDANESTGTLVAESNLSYFGAQLTAAVVDGQLALTLEFDSQRLASEAAEQLSKEILESLIQVIEHCQSQPQRHYTVSDFALLSGISERQLQRIFGQVEGEVEDIYPLTGLQQGMWFHSQTAREAHTQSTQPYIEQASLLLQGCVDIEALSYAWQQLIKQHSILRSAFIDVAGEPLQVVYKHAELPLNLVQSVAIADAQSHVVKSQAEVELAEPLKLSQAPCMRLSLIAFDDGNVGVVWTYHHLIMDGWSLPILFAELVAFYQARCQGELRPIVVDNFRDHIEYLHTHVECDEAFWREYLGGVTTPTLLSEKVLHTENKAAGVKELSVTLPQPLQDAVTRFTSEQGLTVNQFIQGLWAYWVASCCNEPYALFGQTIAGRPTALSRMAQRVGLYINTQAVYVEIDQNARVKDYLQAVKSQLTALAQHPHTPLTQAHQWSGIDNDSPLFDCLYVFENYPQDPLQNSAELPFTAITLSEVDETHYPLTFVVGVGGGVSLTLSYQQQCFDEVFIEQSLAAMQQLMLAATQQPEQTFGKLSWQPQHAQYSKALSLPTFALTQAVPYQTPSLPIQQLFAQIAAEFPEHIAIREYSSVSEEARCYHYSQLDKDANQLAHYLASRLELSTAPVIIGLCLEANYQLIVAMLAVLKLGAAYLPIAPTLPESRRRLLLQSANAAMLVTKIEYWQGSSEQVVPQVDVDSIKDALAAQPSRCFTAPCQIDDLCYVIYTSGTTGMPKGVMVEHASVVNYVQTLATQYAITPSDNYLQFASMSFDVFAEEVFCTLLRGATLVMAPTDDMLDPNKLAQLSQDADLTLMSLPTAYWHQLAATSVTLPDSLRIITIGGEQMQIAALTDWQQRYGDRIRIINAYGPTEATISATLNDVTHFSGARVPIGQPIAGLSLHLLDEQLRAVATGVEGDLYIAGIGLARGYLNDEEKTQQAFIIEPNSGQRLYKTGDRTCCLASNELLYLGRGDDQVKVRGYRIELGEIERQLQLLNRVANCAVVVREDGSNNAQLVAFVQPAQQTEVSAASLRGQLGAALPAYMIPELFQSVSHLPLTTNGKVDRKQLTALAGSYTLSQSQHQEAKQERLTPLQTQLAQQFAHRLQVDGVCLDDNFFNLGGHSLLALRVVGDINQHLQLNLPLSALFEHPTVRGLSQHIQVLREGLGECDGKPQSLETLVCLQEGELGFTPVVLIAGAGGWLMAFHALVNGLDSRIPVYGLQPEALAEEPETLTSIERTAEYYLSVLAGAELGEQVHLVGHSFGSFIAYQLATLLEQQGRSTCSLTVIDTPVPSNPALNLDETQVAQMMLDNLVAFFRLSVSDAEISAYQQGDATARIASLNRWIKQAGFNFSDTHLRHFQQVFSAQLRANIEMRSMLSDIPICVVKTQQTQEFEGRPVNKDMGWQPFSHSLSCYEVKGEHLSCLQAEQVGQLVNIIERNYVLH